MSHNKKRFGVVASMLAVLLLGGGVAFAYWTTSGSGTGTATVGTDTHVKVTQTSTISGLVPGGPAADVDFQVENLLGTGPETISGVSIALTVTSSPGACTAADFDVVQPNIGGPVAIGAGATQAFDAVDTGASVSMKDRAVNQDGCKNATQQLTYTVS